MVITNFRGDFVVDRDGRLEATEIITTWFPSGRHGIFRYWDVANQNDSHIRQVPQVTEILLDDQPVPYKMLWQNQQRFLVAKIGDPDRYLDFGTHVFPDPLHHRRGARSGGVGAKEDLRLHARRPAATSAFFWNVVAPGWNNGSTAPTSRSRCPAGVPGRSARSATATVGRAPTWRSPATGWRLSATNLPPRTR